MDIYQKRKQVAEWLNSKGYGFEFDKDGLWMEDCDFTEHKNKDVIDEIIDYNKNAQRLLSELRKHFLVETDLDTGEPKASIKTILALWDEVNKELKTKTISSNVG